MITITLLAENTVRGSGLIGEHGLAWWIDTGTHRVLFDTGQGMALSHNSRKLGIDLSTADAIVLSHGHYDHVSGLPEALAAAPNASLWLHPAAIDRKIIRGDDGIARRVSTDFMESDDFGSSRKVYRVTSKAEVVPGLWVTGEIPRNNDFEDVGGPFFLDDGMTRPDPIRDDMSLYMQHDGFVSVVFGCAHGGSVNTLHHIFEQIGRMPVDTLVGGLHLAEASPERLDRTVSMLRGISPKFMAFGHCTGAHAVHRLWSEFPGLCHELHVGRRIHLGRVQ